MDNARYLQALASARTSRRIRELVQQAGSRVTGDTVSTKYRQYTKAIKELANVRGRGDVLRDPRWAQSALSKVQEIKHPQTGQAVDAVTQYFYKHGGAFAGQTGAHASPAVMKMKARRAGRDMSTYKGVLPSYMAHEYAEGVAMERVAQFDYATRGQSNVPVRARGGVSTSWRGGGNTALGHMSRHPMLAEYRVEAAMGHSQGGTQGAIDALRRAISRRQAATERALKEFGGGSGFQEAADELSVMDRRILRILERKEKGLQASVSNATKNPIGGLTPASKAHQRAARSAQRPIRGVTVPPVLLTDTYTNLTTAAELASNVPTGLSKISGQIHSLGQTRRLGESFSAFGGVDVEALLPQLTIPSAREMAEARAGTNLPQELSWSVSKQRLYESNSEKFFMNTYAAWGGWEESAAQPVKDAYYRKKMQNAKMWVGSEVHEQIRETVISLAGDPKQMGPAAKEKILIKMLRIEKKKRIERVAAENHLEQLLHRMTSRFEESARNDIKHSTKALRLMEHEAGIASNSLLAEAKMKATKNYQAFSKSNWFEMVANPNNHVISADSLEHFYIDGVKVSDVMAPKSPVSGRVWAGPDLVMTQGKSGKTYIVDWKTELFDKSMSEKAKEAALDKYNLQLRTYALWLSKQDHGVNPADMRMVLAHMQDGRLVNRIEKVNQAMLDATETEIKGYINTMRGDLAEPNINIPRPEAFLSAERYKQYEQRGIVSPTEAELVAAKKSAAEKAEQSRKLAKKAGVTIENAWDAIPRKWKIGGGVGLAAAAAWWMFGSQNDSRKADPRARGYGWTNADVKINHSASTARYMYEGGAAGMGGVA